MSQSDSLPIPAEPVRVLSVKTGFPMVVRFLDQIQGLDTHWKGRTVPCDGPGECPATLHRTGVIWKGYAPVEVWEKDKELWRPWVLEVTSCLEERLRGRNIRGETWALERDDNGKGKRSVLVGVYCETVDPNDIRPTFEILPVLLRIYNCSSLRLGVKNLLPGKVMLSVTHGKPPALPKQFETPTEPSNDPAEVEKMAKALEIIRKRASHFGPTEKINGNGQPH